MIDSVELGLLYRAIPAEERRKAAFEALDLVGLTDKWDQIAGMLSGRQRQRVAVARAFASGAPVVLADEPTGNLDSVNGRSVLESLRALHRRGITIVLITHDESIASQADRRIHILDGVSTSDSGAVLSESPEGRPALEAARTVLGSPLRTRDLLWDTVTSVLSRCGRTSGLALAVAVAVGVALAVATIGLSESSSEHVSQTFDSRENRHVTVTAENALPESTQFVGGAIPTSDDIANNLNELSGVSAAVVVSNHDEHEVASSQAQPSQRLPVYTATSDLVEALEPDIVSDRRPWVARKIHNPRPAHRRCAGTRVSSGNNQTPAAKPFWRHAS